MTIAPERIETRLDAAIDAATARLLELQHADGYWVGELESNATMIAQHLFWHHVLNLRTPELDRKIANELLARQREDGTWSIWFEGPPDLSTSVEAYAALKLAGVDPGDGAREFIRSQGGVAATRIFTKCFLALLGQWPWQRVTPIPVELVLLPPSAPMSIYDFSCWARGTFVPLAACRALRPVRPARIDLREIGARPGEGKPAPRPSSLRRAALREAERWVRAHQEADGSWGGIQPPWVWSILMLVALGHGFEDEALRRAVEGWEGFVIDEGDRLRPEACQSPVWDTGLAVLALRDSGLGPEHPALVRAAEWLEHEEVTVRGDWAVRRPELAPGGWAFEFENDLYPDIDDTAVVALALRRCHRGRDAVDRGLAWTAGMQSRSGGWGAFDADNEAFWLYKLPFCDFGKVTDEPTADVTAHALEALGGGARLRRGGAARPRLAPGRTGSRRLLVRALGCQPPLRHRGRPACARGLRGRARAPRDAPRDRLAGLGAERGRRLRRGHPFVLGSGLPWPRRKYAFPNGLGAISLRRCKRGGEPARPARRGVALQRTARKRRLGGETVHRHRLPS